MEKWMQLARSACWLVVLVSVCHGGNPEAEKQDVPREQGISLRVRWRCG
jgi:hypothetical protein